MPDTPDQTHYQSQTTNEFDPNTGKQVTTTQHKDPITGKPSSVTKTISAQKMMGQGQEQNQGQTPG